MTGHTNTIVTVSFSANGQYILSGSTDNTARLWDTALGIETHKLAGHTEPITAAIFSPNGRYVLSSSTDRTVRLWDVETGSEVRRIIGHTGPINSIYGLAFTANSQYIITGSTDTTARLWDTSIVATMQVACQRVFRDFTVAERATYTITDDRPTCVQ
jgi:WD40 repeat protein